MDDIDEYEEKKDSILYETRRVEWNSQDEK